MVILAFYYTIADFVLLGQCFYYRGFTLRDSVLPPATTKPKPKSRAASRRQQEQHQQATERTALLPAAAPSYFEDRERRGSDWSHLSPAVPLVSGADVAVRPPPAPPTRLQAAASNMLAIVMVCAAGVLGWWLSRGYGEPPAGAEGGENAPPMTMNLWGQVFGWLCAALYLGSRLPQLLLNYRRKSTDGVSMLFFLFACLGNLTYVLSIVVFDPACEVDGECRQGEAAAIYRQYMLVNLSWLAGSAGTLLLDLGIFVQFFVYDKSGEDDDDDESSFEGSNDGTLDEEQSIDGEAWDERPVLERNISVYST
ncbi:PQ loop repeat-domain-containing protein [Lasiosphaeria miniovina]|uniref:PQ loop repeat-domain-containing protein n=1 Tax=Lasiosphaeria miniovina TaxID=1954250 RepID=A0AA40A4K4_9PEZI|nr:PQ loop repeat-domain-containing protein [Lasiosphaeria miniovina]KAK0709152.1 PQ loop repeat-domain-containing protein [Lasiosphaeria miniovina]